MHAVSSGTWELSDLELESGEAVCPDCADRLHVDWDDDDAALVACFCGFSAMATRVVNLPTGWVTSARLEDAREELREGVAALAFSKDQAEATVGGELMTALQNGDLAAVAALTVRAEQLRGAVGRRSAAQIRRAVLALLPVPGEA